MNHTPFWYRIPMIIAVLAVIGGLSLEFTVLRGYASHWWNLIPGFYLLYGALAAVLLTGLSVLGSKLLNDPDTSESDIKERVS